MAIAFIWFREEQEAPFGKPASRAYISCSSSLAHNRVRENPRHDSGIAGLHARIIVSGRPHGRTYESDQCRRQAGAKAHAAQP
jgi:hypothetical protein